MKVTRSLTHLANDVQLQEAMNEEQLSEVFAEKGLLGFKAELDIMERTEDHIQMVELNTLLDFAKASGVTALTFDVTYFPHATEEEVERQLRQLGRDFEISPDVIREVCAEQIAAYLELDAQRDVSLPVHSIVEAYVGGTAVAWYGINEYPRLKQVILRELAAGGSKAKKAFVLRASKAQVEYLDEM